jgi:hypothetical protein
MRVGIRGCERWGWVDSTRLFCEGSFNPSGGIYLVFDAKSGRELSENIGGGFLWSPDRHFLAHLGNVPHWASDEIKSDSLVMDNLVYPRNEETGHRFRSDLTWSPDSKSVAVVDHRVNEWLYLVVARNDEIIERKLPWRERAGECPEPTNTSVRWRGEALMVQHAGHHKAVSTTEMTRVSR